MTTRNSVENLVIGGGLAGSMAAMRLAAANREVLLLEKEREPHHKVCGEFLSAEAIHYLRQAGIEPSISALKPFSAYDSIPARGTLKRAFLSPHCRSPGAFWTNRCS